MRLKRFVSSVAHSECNRDFSSFWGYFCPIICTSVRALPPSVPPLTVSHFHAHTCVLHMCVCTHMCTAHAHMHTHVYCTCAHAHTCAHICTVPACQVHARSYQHLNALVRWCSFSEQPTPYLLRTSTDQGNHSLDWNYFWEPSCAVLRASLRGVARARLPHDHGSTLWHQPANAGNLPGETSVSACWAKVYISICTYLECIAHESRELCFCMLSECVYLSTWIKRDVFLHVERMCISQHMNQERFVSYVYVESCITAMFLLLSWVCIMDFFCVQKCLNVATEASLDKHNDQFDEQK